MPSMRFVERLPRWAAPLIALLLLVVCTVILELATKGNTAFLSGQNLFNILRQWSFVGIIAVGMTFVIVLGGIDLSIGSLVGFIGGLGVLTLNSINTAPSTSAAANAASEAIAAGRAAPPGSPHAFDAALAEVWKALGIGGNETAAVLIAIAVMLIAGTLAGALNGALIAKGRLAPFIATLGGLAAYRSLALAMADGGEYRSSSMSMFGILGQGGIPIPFTNVAPRAPQPVPLLFPWPVVVFIIVALLGWVLLNRTRHGRYVTAIGCNERAAVYSAINVDRIKILTYTLIGFLTGLAALLLASRMNSVSSAQTGVLFELDVIAAVVIGGTRMRGGSGTIVGTVIGVLILGVIGNMLNLLQVSVYLQGLVKGGIIIAAVLAQRGGRT